MFSNAVANLSTSRLLRGIVLPIFERFNPGDIRIRHHYTGQRLLLHSYRHKGYWFHGRRRERSTMQFFQRALRQGDTVVEVGGHIGYLTMLFAQLVGEPGRVVVFEPGQNNLPYLRANVRQLPNVRIVDAAVSDSDGTAKLFEEELTGQNTSLIGDYEHFEQNRRRAFSSERYRQREVVTLRLDTFVRENAVGPDLIKIDIEGAECAALAGVMDYLAKHQPMLMVEVTRRAGDVFSLLTDSGYLLFTPEGRAVRDADSLHDNVCAIHPRKHEDRLRHWIRSCERAAA